jgi:hypothetical protein
LAVTEILSWPTAILKPSAIEANVVAFSRSGGVTLGGLQRVVRTDRGWWSIAYSGVSLSTPAQRRMWNAIAEHCGGMAGLLAVPVWSLDSAAWPAGAIDGQILTTHSDGATHGDDSYYAQPAIGVTLVDAVAIGATSVTLRIGHGIEELSGVRFSHEHALYRTGLPTLVDGTDWTVPVSPAIRAPIPAGADLEFGLPTCLVRLAGDGEMDVSFSAGRFDLRDVAFVEAADYWTDLAAA